MSEADTLVVDTATRIFQDLGDPRTINSAADDAWRAPLWNALTQSGLTLAWVPEDKGGAGASLADGFAVLRVAGAFAVPVPLAETLLAGWLLARAGLDSPAGPMTVAPTRPRDRISLGADGLLSGTASRVPFASETDHIAVAADGPVGPVVALVERGACAVTAGRNMAGEAQDKITFDGVAPVAVAALGGTDDLMTMGAAVRATQMAAALQSLLDISVGYAQERVAFGRPIGKFQAIQHDLARLAGEVAAATAAAGSAAVAIEGAKAFGEAVFLEAASAKIRAGEAANDGALIAHQVHGAIGFTQEHVLHRFTHRLWSWRDDFGGEAAWAVRLGEAICAGGADALWPTITAA